MCRAVSKEKRKKKKGINWRGESVKQEEQDTSWTLGMVGGGGRGAVFNSAKLNKKLTIILDVLGIICQLLESNLVSQTAQSQH